MKDPSLRSNFLNLLSSVDRIVLHEDFAGMGTCGVALIQQFNALRHEVAHMLPEGKVLFKIPNRSVNVSDNV